LYVGSEKIHDTCDVGLEMGLELAGGVMYWGNRDGWTLRPPYSTLLRIRGGTNNPNETVIMRLKGPFSVCGSYIRFSSVPIALEYAYLPARKCVSFMDREPQLLCERLDWDW
jgi:hypothetical protein